MKFEEFESTDFKCDNRFSKFWLKNTQISQFWCQICAFLFFMRNLEFEFHGADFKYDKRFFKVLAQKYPNKLWQFCFFMKFWNYTNLMVLISNITVFQKCSPKKPKEGIFGPKFRLFFSQNFPTSQIWGCWFQIRQ